METKYNLKVFKEDGSLFFSCVGSIGSIRNFIEDFSGMNYVLKVFELGQESEVK